MHRRYSLKKQQLIRNKELYSNVFSQGKKLNTKIAKIKVLGSQLKYPRLGVVVSKKQIKKAVCRSWVKRKIRESFRCNQDRLGNIDLVVVVNSNFIASPENVAGELEKIWEKLKVKQKDS